MARVFAGVTDDVSRRRAILEWHGIYIYSLLDADAPKMNAFDSLKGQVVKVRGVLRHARGTSAAAIGELNVPEHFFFDAAEARVIAVRPPQR